MKQYRTLNDGEIVMEGDEFWGIDRSWIPATEIGKKVTSYTHKMYRRPLTETSSQMTDTCPDCSNHPCDCGLPAGYEVDIRFAANFAPHIKVVEVSKLIEVMQQRDGLRSAVDYASDQLTRVTEQRDRLAEALERIANNNIQDTQQTDYAYELGRMEGIAKVALQSLNQNAKSAGADASETTL